MEEKKKNAYCNVFLRLIVFSFLLVLFFNFVSAGYAVNLRCDAYMDSYFRQASQLFSGFSDGKPLPFGESNKYPPQQSCAGCSFCTEDGKDGVDWKGNSLCNETFVVLRCDSKGNSEQDTFTLSDLVSGGTFEQGKNYEMIHPKLYLTSNHGCCEIKDAVVELKIGEKIFKLGPIGGGESQTIGAGGETISYTDQTYRRPIKPDDIVSMQVGAQAMFYWEKVTAVFEAEIVEEGTLGSLPISAISCGNGVIEEDEGEQCDPPSNKLKNINNPTGMSCTDKCQLNCTKEGYTPRRIPNKDGSTSFVCVKTGCNIGEEVCAVECITAKDCEEKIPQLKPGSSVVCATPICNSAKKCEYPVIESAKGKRCDVCKICSTKTNELGSCVGKNDVCECEDVNLIKLVPPETSDDCNINIKYLEQYRFCDEKEQCVVAGCTADSRVNREWCNTITNYRLCIKDSNCKWVPKTW